MPPNTSGVRRHPLLSAHAVGVTRGDALAGTAPHPRQSGLDPPQYDVVDALLVPQFQECLASPADESELEAGVLAVVLDRRILLRAGRRDEPALLVELASYPLDHQLMAAELLGRDLECVDRRIEGVLGAGSAGSPRR
jgi:hypothetical protein